MLVEDKDMGEHSKLLSPSASGLWLKCTAMPQALIDYNVENKSGHAAQRGTLQHEAAEHYMQGQISSCPDYLDPDEWDEVVVATDAIKNFLDKDGSGTTKKFKDYYELAVAFGEWRAECFGTCDFIRVDMTNKTLYVLDYKFGRVAVDSKENTQLMVYAAATVEQFHRKGVMLADMVDRIVVGISQPKVSKNLNTWEISMTDLGLWDGTVLKPAQQKILDGEGEFVPGSHCSSKWCKFRKDCTAATDKAAGDMDDFMDMYEEGATVQKTINSLSNDELGVFLTNSVLVEQLIKDAREVAKDKIEADEEVKDHKLVNGKGKRKWKSDEEAEKYLKNKLKIDERYKKALLTAPQAETALKKAGKLDNTQAQNAFGKQVEFVDGKPTLAHADDPRPAIVKEVSEEEITSDVEDMFDLEEDAAVMPKKELFDNELSDVDDLLASL